MAKLYFDIGNSRIKLWWCADRQIINRATIVHSGDLSKAMQQLMTSETSIPIESIQGASVLGKEDEACFQALCLKIWGVSAQFAVTTQTHRNIKSAYTDNWATLGVDRWLGILAAYTPDQPVCIVSCGSAITVDCVSPDGQHEGGYILPGFTMMANALLAGTGRVRFSQLEWSDVRLGNTTAKAVSNGLLAAVVALIERLSTEKTQKIILTGGDAEKIIPHLSMAFQYEPELLLYGLQRYFEYAGINTPLALMPNIEE